MELKPYWQEIQIGVGNIMREGKDITLLAIGPIVNCALEAAKILAKEGLDCVVVNARFAKPLDESLILQQAEKTANLLTIEENTTWGGFGSNVLELFTRDLALNVKVKTMGLPDHFIEHGSSEQLRSLLRMDGEGIADKVVTQFPELLAGIPLRHIKER